MFKALKWKYVFSDGVRNSEEEGGSSLHFYSRKKNHVTLVIDSNFSVTLNSLPASKLLEWSPMRDACLHCFL